MSGPAPAEQRRRRNVPVRGDWVTLPAEKFEGERPTLRGLPLVGALSQYSKRAWGSWWASPMAHQWSEAEWPMLLRALVLTELVARQTRLAHTAGLSSLLSELRQLEGVLGISEKGRRDLRWRMPDTDTEPAPSGTASAQSMRRRLTVVSDD